MFDVGHRIVNLRAINNISARKLSKELGVDPSTINKIEKGSANPSLDLLFKICDYFDITPAEFFDIKQSELPPELLKWLDIGKELTYQQLISLISTINALKE